MRVHKLYVRLQQPKQKFNYICYIGLFALMHMLGMILFYVFYQLWQWYVSCLIFLQVLVGFFVVVYFCGLFGCLWVSVVGDLVCLHPRVVFMCL